MRTVSDIPAAAVLAEIADIRLILLRDGDHAVSLHTFGRTELRLAVRHLDSLADSDDRTVRCDVVPCESEKLLNAHPASDERDDAVSQKIVGKIPFEKLDFILFLERKSIKKNFVFASKRQRFQGFAPGNETELLIGEQYQTAKKHPVCLRGVCRP